MPTAFINPNTIVVKTAAQWAVDPNVYNARQRLVTSDEFWGSTDQRKEKVADGVQTWAQLDYPPFATESYVDAGLAGKQPLDSDLTAIAGLTPSNDDVIQRKAGAWINRTMAELWADLKALADAIYAYALPAPVVIVNSIVHTGGSNGVETIVYNSSPNFTGKIQAGDLLMISLGIQGTNSANGKTVSIYFSDSPTSLSNEVLIGQYAFTNAAVNTVEMTKVMAMKTISTQNIISGTGVGPTTGATMGTTAIDFSSVGKYIVITNTLALATETMKIQFGRLVINRPWA